MPNLYLAKKNSYGKQHHSVFPSVTRVNASHYLQDVTQVVMDLWEIQFIFLK
jgi:hypothetical protein